VTTPSVMAEVDRLIAEATPGERPGLVVALSARLAALGAQLASSLDEERPQGFEDDSLLTLPEVARLLGESEHFARELGRRGELPLVRLGKRHLRVRPRALQEWIECREDQGLTTRLDVTYSPLVDRRRAKADPKAARAHTGSTRRAGWDRGQLRSPAGARRDRHPGTGSPADSTDRTDGTQDEG